MFKRAQYERKVIYTAINRHAGQDVFAGSLETIVQEKIDPSWRIAGVVSYTVERYDSLYVQIILEREKKEPCPKCGGAGGADELDRLGANCWITCDTCLGSGVA